MKYKSVKSALNQFEVAFFRLFPPLSIVGAAHLGDPTFLINYGFYFLLVLPVMDVINCIMYWNKDTKDDPKNKVNYNRFHYTLKALSNVVASTMIVLASSFGFEKLLIPGQALFVAGVVGLTGFQYFIKSCGLLQDSGSEDKSYRTVKNGVLSMKLFTVGAGLSLLYFFAEQQAFHEPLGWSFLIVANVFHVVAFNAYDKFNTPSKMIDTGLLIAGVAVIFAAPKLTTGLDAYFHTEIGVGLAMLITGFAISIGRAIYQWKEADRKRNEKVLIPDGVHQHQQQHIAPKTNPVQSPNNKGSVLSFFKYILPCMGSTAPTLKINK